MLCRLFHKPLVIGVTLIFLLGVVRHAAAQARHEMPDTIALQRDLQYREGKSEAWKLDLAYPKERSVKPRPALVIIHGGGWIEGDKSSFTSLSQFLAGPPETLAEHIRKASPASYIEKTVPPLLLIYGTADTQVMFRPVDQFVVAP